MKTAFGIPQDPSLKTCTECGHTKPRTTEYFHKRKESHDGLATKCKVCLNRLHKKHNKAPDMPFLHPIMDSFLRHP